MFFTRNMRRTVMFGVAAVLVMLGTLSLSAISGLRSHQALIDEFRFVTHQMPRPSELASTFGLLFEPLVDPMVRRLPENSTVAARIQQKRFQTRLAEVRDRLQVFHNNLDELPPTPSAMRRRFVTDAFLADVGGRLEELDELQKSLGNAELRRDTVKELLQKVGELQAAASSHALFVPDSRNMLSNVLQDAKGDYRYRFRIICWTTTIAVVLFIGLLRYGHSGIFSPLSKLHQGARRVAQGDFDYRVRLDVEGEIAELADAFNKMTARFQEIRQDLDRQVRERVRQLVRSERLAGIGFLAAGVAHEINNPLSAITIAADSMEDRLDEALSQADQDQADLFRQYFQMIQREASRCQQITNKLLDFARGEEAQRSRYDVTALVSEVLAMVQHMSKFRDRNIEFDDSRPCYAEVNGPEIKQVVLNLVSNALESMELDGTLQIEIIEQTDYVVLRMQDDGCGMTEEVIEHLFEPFFTNRRDGTGTGLGLSISHRIIADHGGSIDAHSDGPGQGTIFHVCLPREASNPNVAA